MSWQRSALVTAARAGHGDVERTVEHIAQVDTQGMAGEPGVSVLDVSTCWALLRSAAVGRLAVSSAEHPDIFPINHLIDHGTVVFRTGVGTKLAAATACPNVAFEADGYDSESGEAWSVVVKGHAEEITTMPEVLDAVTMPLFPWHAGPKHRFVRIVPVDISGRRFHVLDADTWRTPMTDAHRSPLE
jgi:nitroimidazol reductase NimA-like FMN-containing flavoprotein (pyridoxamine 5'-phosphate oxidase superfamily)